MKNLRYFWVLLFTIATATTAQAQGWQQVYNQSGLGLLPGRLITATPTADGGCLMFGIDSWNLNFVARADENGSILWKKNLPGFKSDIRADIFALPNGRFLLGDYVEGGNHSNKVALFESNGDSVWVKDYPGFIRLQPNNNGFLLAQRLSLTQFKLTQVDEGGNSIWEKSFSGTLLGYMSDVRQTADGGFAVLMTTGDLRPKLYRMDSTGNILWERVYPDIPSSYPGRLEYDAAAERFTFLALGNQNTCMVTQVDSLGNLVWSTILPTIISYALAQVSDGYAICGSGSSGKGRLVKVDKQGTVVLNRFYNPKNLGCFLWDIRPTAGDGFLLSGFASHCLLIKTDSLGNVYPSHLTGFAIFDQNHDCAPGPAEPGLQNWPVVATRQADGLEFYAVTDPAGRYEIDLDTGAYAVRIQPQGYLWEPCQATVTTGMIATGDTAAVDFSVQDSVLCALLDVSVSTSRIRRCFDNQYVVSWCNTGTLGVGEASVDVVLSPELDYVSSSLPLAGQSGDTLHFFIGAVDFGECGSMTLTLNADCDSTLLGQTLCVEARIFPDTLCVLPANWSGAQVVASAQCLGDTAVEFRLRNVGTAPTWPNLEYIITEDLVVLMQGPFSLNPGEEFRLVRPANGATLRIAAQQEPNFPLPSQPAAAVEGCGPGGPISFGFINQFAQDDGSPFVDIDCQEVVGSYDPNDKQGFPAGYGNQHFIEPGTDITYLIRFQNTGTDTAFTVAVRDTLSAWLDPASVRPGASSHPYTWSLAEAGVLRFRFDNILLPDSNVNEAASNGFVQFRVSQRADVPLGTEVLNRAGIYFDFNAPVMTNTTLHTVQRDFYTISLEHEPFGGTAPVQVMPNPFVGSTRFVLPDEPSGATTFRLFDAQGRRLREVVFSGKTYLFLADGLRSGVYGFELRNAAGGLVGRGKVVRM